MCNWSLSILSCQQVRGQNGTSEHDTEAYFGGFLSYELLNNVKLHLSCNRAFNVFVTPIHVDFGVYYFMLIIFAGNDLSFLVKYDIKCESTYSGIDL